jgi:hypothetical protein
MIESLVDGESCTIFGDENVERGLPIREEKTPEWRRGEARTISTKLD